MVTRIIDNEKLRLNFSRSANRDVGLSLLSFNNENLLSKKVSVQDETGKSKDQPSEDSGAATPQSSPHEDWTGELKGIKYYMLF